VSRARLEELRPENFSAILILADESGSGAIVDADSRSLAVQLLLRDIQACRSCQRSRSTENSIVQARCCIVHPLFSRHLVLW